MASADIDHHRSTPLEPQEVRDKHERIGVNDGVEITVIIDTNLGAENAINWLPDGAS